jgi:CBS domain-containing protein
MAENTLPFLDIAVEEVMTTDPETIEPEAPLSDAAEALLRGGFRHLPVVNGTRRLVGMLSERDLRVKLGTNLENFPDATVEALSEPVSSAMSPDPLSIGPRAKLADALEIFADERIGALPVVDEGDRLLGILSYVDVLVFLNSQRPKSQTSEARGLPPRSEAPAPPGRRPARPPAKKASGQPGRGARRQGTRKAKSGAARRRGGGRTRPR